MGLRTVGKITTSAANATLHWHISLDYTMGPIVVVPSFLDDNIPGGTYYGKATIGEIIYDFEPIPDPPPNEVGPGKLTYYCHIKNDLDGPICYALQIGSFE